VTSSVYICGMNSILPAACDDISAHHCLFLLFLSHTISLRLLANAGGGSVLLLGDILCNTFSKWCFISSSIRPSWLFRRDCFCARRRARCLAAAFSTISRIFSLCQCARVWYSALHPRFISTF